MDIALLACQDTDRWLGVQMHPSFMQEVSRSSLSFTFTREWI
jgi:hypothetical protein